MLAEALAGRSRADTDWWGGLDPPTTDVVTSPGGEMPARAVVDQGLGRRPRMRRIVAYA
ncbi:hypothetical protein [Streptomyces sp. MST-110588]|uniref:hypothetical protein n=1 Tax=Streptomyces sp. MST-110588 TaxID=2833628 RepID=UPI001F5CB513|nr:hypothetical protein [Streptomyces sp. MST-110588]UNO41464.1 hypothetical protein KGS77_20200 [Streptomyces sp. MST-110588]